MKKRIFGIAICLILLICILVGCSGNNESQKKYSDISDLKGAKVGIITGTVFDKIATESMEEPELVYYYGLVDIVAALTGNKIDCFLCDEPAVKYLSHENKDITYITGDMETEHYALMFAKSESGEKLRDEFNEFFRTYSEGDKLEKLQEYWFTPQDEPHKVLDYSSLPDINGTIKICTDSEEPPFEFYEGENLVGYDIEIVYDFCKSAGYAMELHDMKLESMIPAIVSGKYDIACSPNAITDERMKSVNFSEPLISEKPVVVIRTADSAEYSNYSEEGTGLGSIILGIKKTFLKDGRWKIFLGGIKVTLLISIYSLILGTLLGFGTYMWYRRGSIICNKITGFFRWLLKGMPEVLMLLIFYYIIFGNVEISGLWVSVIVFTLIVGINVFEIIKSEVNAIDRGQTEAALTMGYSSTAAFFKMILPQAMQNIMPKYKATASSLIKSTAIVGYVAVQDLTKISDIVRSRTYDAFFPLIVTAIMYFLIAWIVVMVIDKIQIKCFPVRKSRKKIMEGIEFDEEEEK